MPNEPIRRKYTKALETLIGRKLTVADGLKGSQVVSAERRLNLKLPLALREYYEVAGKLSINTDHNKLYSPPDLLVREGKLLFMEENQAVVFWGMDLKELGQLDPEVFQAANVDELVWYSEERKFSDWIIKVLEWQSGLDPGI
jgi:hypothetical protein